VGTMQAQEDENEAEDKWLDAESEREPQAPRDGVPILFHEVSIETYL